MMKTASAVVLLLFLAVVLFQSGCASLAVHAHDPNLGIPYAGVMGDAGSVYEGCRDGTLGLLYESGARCFQSYGVALLGALDLPLSLVADTTFLPWDLYHMCRKLSSDSGDEGRYPDGVTP